MKKALFLAGAITLAAPAFAQNGFYLSPSIGVGIGNVKMDLVYTNQNGNTITQSSILSYNAKIGIGYKYKNWRFQTGLQYFTTGYKLNGLLFSSQFDPNNPTIIGTGSSQLIYNHFGVPLQIGYTIWPGKKLSIVPYIGVLTSYNLGVKSKVNEGEKETVNKWPKESFENIYNRFSVWGTTALQLEYKVNKRISILGGPSMQYTISNFNHNPSGVIYKSTQRNYNINFDLGVNINL